MSALDRLPIRLRVTLVFTSVMAIVLAGAGLFLYLRLGTELDTTIEQTLRSRAGDVTALVAQADADLEQSGRGPLTEQGEDLAQVLDASGKVVDGSSSLRARPLLAGAALERALRRTTFFTASEGEEAARFLATPVTARGRRLVVVVGTRTEERDEAIRNLGGLLLVGGPVTLLLAAVAGYGALTAALRPVESMRRRAAAIHDVAPGQRLPVPPAKDEVSDLGQTLNAMLERLEEAFARERTFVADASHELRTPLAILKAELELALRGGRSVAELEDALRSAAEETDRLVQLAQDLLVIARSDQGRLPIRPDALEIRGLLHSVRERFARRAADQGAQLVVSASEELLLVGDALRLEQAVGNLVENALRHGGRRIELAAHRDGDAVELHVRDDGPGFPPGFTARAFDRFTRADSARGRGGAGLGLAIVAAIAEAHGGRAAARNLSGGGADVWLALPTHRGVDRVASRAAADPVEGRVLSGRRGRQTTPRPAVPPQAAGSAGRAEGESGDRQGRGSRRPK